MNNRQSYLSSILCFLAGGFAGAGLSLLLAPRSGRATRQIIAGRLSEGADSVRAVRDRAVARGGAVWDDAAHRVSEVGAVLSASAEGKAGKRSDGPAT
jgi:gas vesicle protein